MLIMSLINESNMTPAAPGSIECHSSSAPEDVSPEEALVSEVGSPLSEVGSPLSEVGSPESEVGTPESEVGATEVPVSDVPGSESPPSLEGVGVEVGSTEAGWLVPPADEAAPDEDEPLVHEASKLTAANASRMFLRFILLPLGFDTPL